MLNMNREDIIYHEDAENGSILTFSMTKETSAAGSRNSIDIIGMQAIIQLPGAPSHVKGFIELGGKIVPIIDVRVKCGKEVTRFCDRTCIVVMDVNGVPVGLLTDNMADFLAPATHDCSVPVSIN